MKLREIYHLMLRRIFEDVPVTTYKLLLVGLVAYSVLPLFFYPDPMFYKIYYYLSFVTVGIISLCIILYFPIRHLFDRYYGRIANRKGITYTASKPHFAIIVVRYRPLLKTMFYILTDFKSFFKTLDENRIPYRVHVIDSKDGFLDIIGDKNVNALFIFGHGRRHGIKFGNEIWSYLNVPLDTKPGTHIKYVGQFHCNHEKGKSLFEHLGCDGVLVDGVTLCYDINDYFESKKYVPILKRIIKVR